MASSLSPTQRTLKFLRDAGYAAGIVEKHNAYAGPPAKRCPACGKNRIGMKQDLFGWCDLVAIHPEHPGTLYVQTTSNSGSNHSSRRAKIVASAEAQTAIEAQNRIWIVSWAKQGAAGKRKLWTPRIDKIEIGDFAETGGLTE